MEWLWGELVAAAAAEGKIAGGDSACGFANTAMQLAHQKLLPEVLAAVVRAMAAARSLVAYECGATGPSKDCAYEGPVLKAITGCTISMEGKSAACAHLSPVGNIACMAADLWSNESVQNVKLLSAKAPEVFLEILAYDCRLLNAAARQGKAAWMRDLLVESDEYASPQALVLGPEATIRIARARRRACGRSRPRCGPGWRARCEWWPRGPAPGPAGSRTHRFPPAGRASTPPFLGGRPR
jgi:methanol--5-hydroxybenzimidazolylcobamide Co-methyltransferase